MPFEPSLYRLASITREKLCREAAKASHDLRLLVSHANLLDELLIQLNAPGDGSIERYGFDLLPQEVHTERLAHRPVLVNVEELSELESADGGASDYSRHLSYESSPSTLPMLSHDSESDSDSSDSDEVDESDESDDFSTVIGPTSTTDISKAPISSEEVEVVGPDESDLGLRRTVSAWRLFGGTNNSTEERQRAKATSKIVVNDVERVKLSTA